MGMYTGLEFKAKLNIEKLTMQELKHLVLMVCPFLDHHDIKFDLIHHPFFKTDRWGWMFQGGSSYLDDEFYPESYFCLEKDELYARFNIKNYTGEIEKFLEWISPFVLEFNGKYKYEEMDNSIPLIHNDQGIIVPDYSKDLTNYGA